MGEPDKSLAKQAKKEAKQRAKMAKKEAEVPVLQPAPSSPDGVEAAAVTPPAHSADCPTPAERSAVAAERAVAINRKRLIVQVIAAILALATVLIAWLTRSSSPSPAQEENTTVPTQPAAETPDPA